MFASGSLTSPVCVCTTRLATVVVDVHHPAGGVQPLRDLMGVVGRGQAGADVQELPDTRLGDQVRDGAGEKLPVVNPGRLSGQSGAAPS